MGSLAGLGHRQDVDGLRAVAVLLVVLFHVGIPGITGGFVGVDVFFVISGYLITALLVTEAQKNSRISLTNFYARRVRRLLPALALVVAVTLALGAIWLLPIFDEQQRLAKSAVATSVFLSNVYFWRSTGGYFDAPTAFMPLLHTWSLAVEEQFYLFWPPIIIGVLKLVKSNGETFKRYVTAVIALALVLSFVFSLWSTSARPQMAFYLVPARAWEFAIGGLLAMLLPTQQNSHPKSGAWLSAGGLAMIVGSAFWLNERDPFPGFNAVLPVLGAGAVIAGGVYNSQSLAVRFLTVKPMIVIGLLSYSWYLWHWPLLAIARANDSAANLGRDALLGLVSLGAAALAYRYVENPIRFQRPGPFAKTWPTLAMGVVISVGIAGAAVALKFSADRLAASNPKYVELIAAMNDTPPLRPICHQDAPFVSLVDQSRCTIGTQKPVTAMLWGDSLGDHLSPTLQEYAKNGSGSFLQRTFSNCRPVGEEAVALSQSDPDCGKFNDAVLAEIAQLRSQGMKGVVLSAFWPKMFGDEALQAPVFDAKTASYKSHMEAAIEALDKTVSQLEAEGLRVLIVEWWPALPRYTAQCLARYEVKECSARRESIDSRRKATHDALLKIQEAHKDSVRLWDPIEHFCDKEWCLARNDTTTLYTDGLHISATAARQLSGLATEQFEWLFNR